MAAGWRNCARHRWTARRNLELIALVAAHFKLRRSQVSIRSGASARVKRVQLDAADD